MGTHPVPERFDIRLQPVPNLDSLVVQDLRHHVRIVASLRPRADLLSSDEHVVRVGVSSIFGIGHGVEGPDGGGVLVDYEEVRAIIFLDCRAERKFL